MLLYKNRITELAILFIGLLLLQSTACKKGWLDAKSDISLVVPSSIKDLQSLLDNDGVFNGGNATLGEIGADNYYLEDAYYEYMDKVTQQSYIWQSSILDATTPLSEWSNPYKQVYYTNVVLEKISEIDKVPFNEREWNDIKGSAHFFRAFAYYDMLQIFAKPYSENSSNEDMGIPLRLSTNIKEAQPRASVQESYNQVLADLKQAIPLLPNVPLYKTRPSKPTAYGLLARVYLSMDDYLNAYLYADSCIQLYNSLVNYNNVNADATLPFPVYNDEVIFHNYMTNYLVFFPGISYVDTALYNSYKEGDLRKIVFFNFSDDKAYWKGNYSGSGNILFNGIATDEIYLIRAEANARNGNSAAAMDDLNTLLATRWITGEFLPLTVTDADDALNTILIERRKELLFRGLRWTDLRRLNKDPRFAITLTRKLNGQAFTLPPNDNRYVYPIPNDEILYSGIPQNPR